MYPVKYKIDKIHNKIRCSIKELILKMIYLFWMLMPYKVKIIIVNLAKTFYRRNKSMLYMTAYANGPKFTKNESNITIQVKPFVSIIIPIFNNPYQLKNCLEAIKKNTQYKNYEVILVDNNSFDKKSLEVIKKSSHRAIRYSYAFNYSKINNFAARYAKGEYLLFLNNDTMPTGNWLVPMLCECQKEGVGIVGSKLLYNDNTIQHAGLDFDAKILRFSHPYQHQIATIKEASYIKEVPAVTGACLMIKKELFEKVRGFDEDYWVEFQDVDLCFKVRELGFKVIYTPYSVVYHQEGATRNLVSEKTSLYDSFRLRKKWLDNYLILNSDNAAKHTGHKILLIKLLSMGDVIIVTSVIEAVRKKYPQSEIVFATSNQYRDIIEGNHYLNRMFACRDYDRSEFNNELSYYKAITLELLYKEDWDLVYQLQVIDLPGGFWETGQHLRDLYADLANVRIKDEKEHIPITDLQRSKIKSLFNAYVEDGQKIVLLHTTSGWNLKDWDYKKYPLLISRIQDRYNIRVFQIGGSEDEPIEYDDVVHLEGKLTLKELAALMQCSDLLICPDSGLMHMASAMGLATVALFGPTGPSACGPINGNNYICIQSNLRCDTPCYTRRCRFGRSCTRDISVDIVLDAVTKVLDKDKNVTCARKELIFVKD